MSEIQTHKVMWQARLSGRFDSVFAVLDEKKKLLSPEGNPQPRKRRVYEMAPGLKLITQSGMVELNADNPRVLEQMMVLTKKFANILLGQDSTAELVLQMCSLRDFSYESKNENDRFEECYYTRPKFLDGYTPNFISWETHDSQSEKIIWRLGKITDIVKRGDKIPIHRVVIEHFYKVPAHKMIPILSENVEFYKWDDPKIREFICMN